MYKYLTKKTFSSKNPLASNTYSQIKVGSQTYNYYDINKLNTSINHLPYSIRVLLESALRNCDEFAVKKADVEKILNWRETQQHDVEIPFKPARVLLQDFT